MTDSRIWKYVHHCTSYLSGENQWFPYDVAMNIIQHSHHTRIHADCSQTEVFILFNSFLLDFPSALILDVYIQSSRPLWTNLANRKLSSRHSC